MMTFTFEGYNSLIKLLTENGYEITNYHLWKDKSRCAILRHDVDYDLEKATELANIEYNLGVKSTYFLLLTSDYYNIFSKKSFNYITQIINCGHEIGLHFDELRYPEHEGNIRFMKEKIIEESILLGTAINSKISTVSMHRPSKNMLNANLEIPGITNSYGDDFYKTFKYLSDSRRNWREPIDEIIKSGQYNRLHILTHAFWYNEKELNLQDSLLSFLNKGNIKRFSIMNENFTRLEEEVSIKQILGSAPNED